MGLGTMESSDCVRRYPLPLAVLHLSQMPAPASLSTIQKASLHLSLSATILQDSELHSES